MWPFRKKAEPEKEAEPFSGIKASIEIIADNWEKDHVHAFDCDSYEDAKKSLPEKAKEVSEAGSLIKSADIVERLYKKGELVAECRLKRFNKSNAKIGCALREMKKTPKYRVVKFTKSGAEIKSGIYAGRNRWETGISSFEFESAKDVNDHLYSSAAKRGIDVPDYGDFELRITEEISDGYWLESRLRLPFPTYSMPCDLCGEEGPISFGEGKGKPLSVFAFDAEEDQSSKTFYEEMGKD